MEIDHGGEEFPYEQLARLLEERINSGEYAPGAPIPSIERLRQESGLSIMTIRRAVQVLADKGMVRVRPGRGTFVVRKD